MGSPLAVSPPMSCCPRCRLNHKYKPPLQSNLTPSLEGRQVMGPGSKQTLRLSRCIFKSFLLATVQNHGGRVAAQWQPAPAPPQGQVQNTKRESQIQHGGGGWGVQ